MTYPRFANVASHSGDFFDWRNDVPDNPKTGEQWDVLRTFTGGVLINLSHRRHKGKWTSGGPWLIWKEEVLVEPSGKTRTFRSGNRRAYEGTYRPSSYPQPSNPNNWNSSGYINARYTDLKNRGAEAWNRMRPDLPDFSFATAVYELKDPLPVFQNSLRRVMRQTARRIPPGLRGKAKRNAEWYLALQFGYLPIVRDIINYQSALQGADRRLQQLIRNEGRPQRRKRELKNVADSSTSFTISPGTLSSMQPVHVTQCYGPGGTTQEVTNRIIERTWCSGRFRYLLPPGPRDLNWERLMLKRIMGHRITPRELYQVIPWSWLADYFTDLGQFISAVSPGVADRLIADYAFLMSTLEWSATSTVSQVVRTTSNGPTSRIYSKATRTRTIKMRVAASPFGFGFTQNDLSAHQVSILGALGISRI